MLFIGEAYLRGARGLTADHNLARGHLTAAAESSDPEVTVAARKALSQPDPLRPSPGLKNLLINPSPAPRPATSIYNRLSIAPPAPPSAPPPAGDKN
ncbi:MAG: hypothetical protein IPM17_14500 [Verrucomicrobia bacterium]|nr:hypothetical protein [Verrucomicrobiota bacterium]